MADTPENQQQYGSILTVAGENAEQNGKLLNKQVSITHIAIGDAGDAYVQPDRAQVALVNEITRIPVNAVDVLQPTPESVPMLKVEAVLPDTVVDIVIREFAAVATFNGNDYLHAVGNCARIYVPDPANNGGVQNPVTLEMIFVITSAEPIVEIDPGSVIASREWVGEQLKNMKPFASVAALVASAVAGKLVVGEVYDTTAYHDGWGGQVANPTGGNSYQYRDAGSPGARPAENLGSIFHVPGGSGGLYFEGQFDDDEVKTSEFGVRESAADNWQRLQHWADYVGDARQGVMTGGRYKISATLDMTRTKYVRSEGCTLIPTFNGTAVKIEPGDGALVEDYEYTGTLRVEWPDINWTVPRDGFYLQNMYNCRMDLACRRATRGIVCEGWNAGFVHNDIYVSDMFSNGVGVWLTARTATGWCNSNRFHGGFFYGSHPVVGSLYAAQSGHIYIDDEQYPVNGNVFLNPSLEWVGDDFMLARMRGLRNRIEPRYSELNGSDNNARSGAWYTDHGTENIWAVQNVPYVIGYDDEDASPRLDVRTATRPFVMGSQGYEDLGTGTKHVITDSLDSPAIRAVNKNSGPGLVAQNRSSGANPGLKVLGPTGDEGVAIPAAGTWIVFNGERKVEWNAVVAPLTGDWQRGDIAWNAAPSVGQPSYWQCVQSGSPGVWGAGPVLV